MKLSLPYFLSASVLLLTGTNNNNNNFFVSAQQAVLDIPGAALNAGNYGTFVAALGAAGLTSSLQEGYGPFTVFAPTDSAFAALPAGLLNCLLLPQNFNLLNNILLYHVIGGPRQYSSSDLLNLSTPATTLSFEALLFGARPSTGELLINNGVTVVQPDMMASNGVVHGIGQGTYY